MSNSKMFEDKSSISAGNQEEANEVLTGLEKLCGRVKESLQSSQERFRIAIEHMRDWEYWTGPDGRYVFVSPACKRITGYAQEEFQNNPELFLKIVHPEDHTLVASHLEQEGNSDDMSPINFRIVTREDEERWIAHLCQRVYSSTGEWLGVRASNSDITERVRADAQRRKFEECIQESAKKIEGFGRFANSVANDFNNLVQVIMGNAELALEGLQSASRTPETIKGVEKETSCASTSSSRLLTDADKEKFVDQQLNVNTLIEEMKDTLNSSVSKHIEMIHLPAAGLPLIEADKQQIRQVILSLVTNASEAIGANEGYITMVTGSMNCDQTYFESIHLGRELKEGPYVYFEVSDNGPGMDNTTLQKIFDASFSTKASQEGLGLSASSDIVEKHDGAIKVESELDAGTSVRVLFPVAQQKTTEEEDKSENFNEHNSSPKGTIMLVDDEEFILTMARDMLELVNFKVITAQDGGMAVDLFREHKEEIRCILLDLNMPGKSGKETFEELRAMKADVPIIISSGNTENDVKEQFGGTVPAEFLQKPYHFSTLIGNINDLFSNSQN